MTFGNTNRSGNRGWITAGLSVLGLVGGAQQAWAHATERGFVLLLPTEYYLFGGGAAVAFTFAALLVIPVRVLGRGFAARWSWRSGRPAVGVLLSLISFVVFAVLIAAGLTGTRDPLENPLPIMIWTVWWVGFTLVTAVVGDLWRLINPWTGPLWLMRRILGLREARLSLPSGLGYWPAMAGLFCFAWFELVDIAPDDPARLAYLAGAYWLGTLIAMLLFGEASWRRHGEIFAVFFGLIARIGPVWSAREGDRLVWFGGVPGAQLVATQALPISGVLFVLLALASVSFDGLNKTFWWLALIGVNPLEFPGRSAVTLVNTLGFVGAFGALTATYFAAVMLGNRFTGIAASSRECLGRLVLSVMPIALGYHFSHYLTVLLINGQYALVAASDPFGIGADLLGIGNFHVTTSFLNHLGSVEIIWRAQAAGIVVAHLLAVLVAHGIAFDIYGDARRAALSQIPLAVLMIAYTVFGLWLLATPTGS